MLKEVCRQLKAENKSERKGQRRLWGVMPSTYVGCMLRLTSLAPDIIEVILRGDEPDGLSLEKLRKNLPVRWEEQRMCWMKS